MRGDDEVQKKKKFISGAGLGSGCVVLKGVRGINYSGGMGDYSGGTGGLLLGCGWCEVS